MAEIKNNEMFLLFFSRKVLEPMIFVKEEFLKKIQKKDVFVDLTTLPENEGCSLIQCGDL